MQILQLLLLQLLEICYRMIISPCGLEKDDNLILVDFTTSDPFANYTCHEDPFYCYIKTRKTKKFLSLKVMRDYNVQRK